MRPAAAWESFSSSRLERDDGASTWPWLEYESVDRSSELCRSVTLRDLFESEEEGS
jgi:hypothetical protein